MRWRVQTGTQSFLVVDGVGVRAGIRNVLHHHYLCFFPNSCRYWVTSWRSHMLIKFHYWESSLTFSPKWRSLFSSTTTTCSSTFSPTVIVYLVCYDGINEVGCSQSVTLTTTGWFVWLRLILGKTRCQSFSHVIFQIGRLGWFGILGWQSVAVILSPGVKVTSLLTLWVWRHGWWGSSGVVWSHPSLVLLLIWVNGSADSAVH